MPNDTDLTSMARKANFRILAVDDDPVVLEMLYALLGHPDREVLLARSLADLESYYEEPAPDVVLLDWQLPDGDGLTVLPLLKQRWPLAQVVLMSGYATTEVVVEAIKRGAYHFKTKPFSGEDLRRLVETVRDLKERTQSPPPAAAKPRTSEEEAKWPVAESAVMKQVLRLTARVAPNDLSVLITGESGTGKEVIANLLHGLSLRAKGPLVSVNCAALPGELIEAELFGVVKGAYTGASTSRGGLIKEATGGTLFLDEIAEMPMPIQAKLLRVLQQREYRPVGGVANLRAECRFIAATNRDPAEAIAGGKLRSDLFYRIAAMSIQLPPLRERPEDIIPLAEHFIATFAAEAGRVMEGLTPAAAEAIRQFPWPGNVRELENELHRAVILTEQARIDLGDLDPRLDQARSGPVRSLYSLESPAPSTLHEAEKSAILAELESSGGSKRAAAKKLGIARQTLYNKLREYGIDQPPPGGAKDRPD